MLTDTPEKEVIEEIVRVSVLNKIPRRRPELIRERNARKQFPKNKKAKYESDSELSSLSDEMCDGSDVEISESDEQNIC